MVSEHNGWAGAVGAGAADRERLGYTNALRSARLRPFMLPVLDPADAGALLDGMTATVEDWDRALFLAFAAAVNELTSSASSAISPHSSPAA